MPEKTALSKSHDHLIWLIEKDGYKAVLQDLLSNHKYHAHTYMLYRRRVKSGLNKLTGKPLSTNTLKHYRGEMKRTKRYIQTTIKEKISYVLGIGKCRDLLDEVLRLRKVLKSGGQDRLLHDTLKLMMSDNERLKGKIEKMEAEAARRPSAVVIPFKVLRGGLNHGN